MIKPELKVRFVASRGLWFYPPDYSSKKAKIDEINKKYFQNKKFRYIKY